MGNAFEENEFTHNLGLDRYKGRLFQICFQKRIFSKRKQNTGDKHPTTPESDIIYSESGNRDPGILG